MKLERITLWPVLALLAVVGGVVSPAQSAADDSVRRLSLQEAIVLARSNSYQVRIARSAAAEAQGQNLEAWRAYLPEVVVSERAVRSNDPVAVFGTKLRQGIFSMSDFDIDRLNDPDRIDNFTTAIEVRQPLINLDAMFGKSAARSATKASAFALLRAEEAVALEAERVYYALVLSRANLETIIEAARSAETHHREIEAAHDRGLVSESDLLASSVRLAEVEEQRLNARLSIDNAGDQLRFLLGLDGTAEIVPTDSLALTDWDLAVAEVPLDTVPEGRADLRAFRYQQEAASRSERAKKTEWLPRMNAFGSTEWSDEDAFGTSRNYWTAGLVLEWSLFEGFGKWGRANQAAARSAAARTRLREAEARSNMEVRRSYRALLTAKERVGVAKKAVLHASESLRIVEARFEQGMEKASDLLDRESAHTNAQLRLLRALYDFKVARSELDFYLGSSGNEAR
jgi:outer membrane protein